jgi:hypothetical protein
MNSISGLQEASPQGLGNLADELEQAWDDDGDIDQEQSSNFLEGLREGEIALSPSDIQSPYAPVNDMADFGLSNGSISSPPTNGPPPTLQVPSPQQRQKKKPSSHNRNDSAYDGSDYGSEPDDELNEFPPLLRKRIRELEKLARDGNEVDSVSEGGGTIKRTISALRDLGPQSNIEFGITRMATAYMSMATHRSHKQRELFTLSHSLMYSMAGMELPPEFLDLLMSEIEELAESMRFLQYQNPLLSLQILASQTSDLTTTLRSLTDLLQENRLAANAASRKLKSVRDMVDDMKYEEELVDNSIMLIQAGDWDRRCRERQAGRLCGEVVRGFGERWGIDVPVSAPVKG